MWKHKICVSVVSKITVCASYLPVDCELFQKKCILFDETFFLDKIDNVYFQPPYLLLRDVFSQIRILSLGGKLKVLEEGFLVYFCFFVLFVVVSIRKRIMLIR